MKKLICLSAILVSLFSGCGDPAIHDVTGKVTLGGKPHERIVVSMRPKDGKPTRFNLAIGSTDKDGVLSIGTNAGGLAEGIYRVTFSYTGVPKVTASSKKTGKDADRGNTEEARELIQPPYDDMTSGENSPVEFSVTGSGENYFEFDIPE